MIFKDKHINLEACLFYDCPWLTIHVKKESPIDTIRTCSCSCERCEKDCPCYEDQLLYQKIYKDYLKKSQEYPFL